eukprot:3932156-Rhodomonas_salina.1
MSGTGMAHGGRAPYAMSGAADLWGACIAGYLLPTNCPNPLLNQPQSLHVLACCAKVCRQRCR